MTAAVAHIVHSLGAERHHRPDDPPPSARRSSCTTPVTPRHRSDDLASSYLYHFGTIAMSKPLPPGCNIENIPH
jgi:hypothetical protein